MRPAHAWTDRVSGLHSLYSGCPRAASTAHNPDTWHLKHGTGSRSNAWFPGLGTLLPALRSMQGGLTISGGEALGQPAFTRRIFSAAKSFGLHTALDTSGFPRRECY